MKITDIREIEVMKDIPSFEIGSRFVVYPKSHDVVCFRKDRATFSNQWIKKAIKRGLIRPTRIRVVG